MKIKLELFGASRDFSDNDHLEIEVQNKASVEDLTTLMKLSLPLKFLSIYLIISFLKSFIEALSFTFNSK